FIGAIKEIEENEGSTINEGNLLGYIETEENEAAAQTTDNKDIEKEVKTENKEETKDQAMASRDSPAVLKLSQNHGIDLNDVTGTGLGGRITRKDIIALDKSNEKEFESSKESEQDQVKREVEQPEIKTDETDVEIPLSQVRRAVAQNIVQSRQKIHHECMRVEADV